MHPFEYTLFIAIFFHFSIFLSTVNCGSVNICEVSAMLLLLQPMLCNLTGAFFVVQLIPKKNIKKIRTKNFYSIFWYYMPQRVGVICMLCYVVVINTHSSEFRRYNPKSICQRYHKIIFYESKYALSNTINQTSEQHWTSELLKIFQFVNVV